MYTSFPVKLISLEYALNYTMFVLKKLISTNIMVKIKSI